MVDGRGTAIPNPFRDVATMLEPVLGRAIGG
jgi:hypothetical protein